MQNSVLKFLMIFLLATVIIPTVGYSQLDNSTLSRADSLFLQKRYTQSFEIYKNLFDNKQYTPSMLLKMAFIQEGLNRISESVYYLNIYYIASQDEAALVKLEELADKYRLEGFARSEGDQIFSIYNGNRTRITFALILVVVFLIVLMSVQRFRFHAKPYAAWVMLIIVSVACFAHLNFGEGNSKAIIANTNTYLMDGPSAGASVVSIVRDGHRVTVLGKEDVWLKVQWGEDEAYVKENNVLPVKL
jgi:hypothetical protein